MPETLKGLKKMLAKLDKFKGDMPKKVGAVVAANALEMAATAKRLAPHDTGKLRQDIAAFEAGKLTWKVLANSSGLAPYSAYMEFGTGGLVEVPSEFSDIAIQFIGKGVKEVNIRPRPYMYPALVLQRKQFLKDLKHLLDTETKKI